ncbi:MAG TPA: hypothetical protein VGC22_01265, partial [Chitinophaga sp.]
MLFPVKHPAVNWIDGMKISRQQFIDTEDHFADALRDATSLFLHSYDFGLLPPFRGQRQSCDFEITERVTSQVEVRLRQCNAITPGGLRIHLLPQEYSDQLVRHYTFSDAEGADEGAITSYSIVLRVNPYERVPTGIPNPAETPPRHPHALHAYELSVLPGGQVEAGDMGLH